MGNGLQCCEDASGYDRSSSREFEVKSRQISYSDGYFESFDASFIDQESEADCTYEDDEDEFVPEPRHVPGGTAHLDEFVPEPRYNPLMRAHPVDSTTLPESTWEWSMLWRSSDPIPEEAEEEEEEEDVDAGELEEEDAEEEYPYTAGHTVLAPARRHTEKAPAFLTFLQEQCGSHCFEARRRRKRTNAGMPICPPIDAELTLDEGRWTRGVRGRGLVRRV
jgi:hypothetical protein